MKELLKDIYSVLDNVRSYQHACRILSFDQQTVCPPKAMEEQGEVQAFLENKAFCLLTSDEFTRKAEQLYENRDSLMDERDRSLALMLHREHMKTKNITPEMNKEFSLITNKAFVNWIEAKEKADFSIFLPSLSAIREMSVKEVSLREEALPEPYDNLLYDYEYGLGTKELDECFSICRKRLVPLLKKIMNSKKKIRTDFLSRRVSDEQQKEMARYLLDVIGFDFTRGTFSTSEHPFTDGLGKNDVRVTTNYDPDMFCSSIFSIVHEGGHALFELLQPEKNFAHHIEMRKTMGMHESVSRFYENRIGRSKAFIHLIFDKAREIFPQVLCDVTEKEFYEAVNVVTPSLIRTDADEFTYIFHIMIRYELEKMILSGEAPIQDLPTLWSDKYEEYLGIRPSNDREGVLQDVHWTSGFGYFPSYAIGNMYNAMYFNCMQRDLDVDAAVSSGDFASLNAWMAEHVFKKADILDPVDWIKDITGRSLTPDDFLDYLEKKYTEIYDL